jgi:hypothetical protein
MKGLFDFFRSNWFTGFIIFFILLFFILKSYVFYNNRTALNFITIYFIHFILVCSTIFFAVILNHSVDMSDMPVTIGEPIKDDSTESLKETLSTVGQTTETVLNPANALTLAVEPNTTLTPAVEPKPTLTLPNESNSELTSSASAAG